MLLRQSSSAAALRTSESHSEPPSTGRRPGERASGYTQPTLVADDDAIAQIGTAPARSGTAPSGQHFVERAEQRLAPQPLPPRVVTRAID